MLKFNNLKKGAAVANHSGAMEADTISKNGRSSKSQMSRTIFRKITIVVIVSTFSVAISAQNREAIGVQAGVNFTTLSGWLRDGLGSSDVEINKKTGIQLGVYSALPFGSSNFGLQSEILFSQLGFKLEDNQTQYRSQIRETGTLNLNCFMARAHIRYKYAFTDDFALALHSGFNAAYSLWASTKYEKFVDGKKIDGESDSFFGDAAGKAAEVGVGLGAAFTIMERYRIDVNYDAGIIFHNLSLSLTYMIGK